MEEAAGREGKELSGWEEKNMKASSGENAAVA